MASVYIFDNDPWLMDYNNCEKVSRDIMDEFTEHSKYTKASSSFKPISSSLGASLMRYSRDVNRLKNALDNELNSRFITAEEAERRRRQIEILVHRDMEFQKLYQERARNLASARASLLRSDAPVFVDGGTTSWAADDDDDKYRTTHMSVTDLAARQDKILQEQDKGLEELCKVIARQKEIGQNISNEVDHQNEIIDDLADHMDRTDESLISKTNQIQKISFKDRTCSYWVVIIFLFVCIIAVVLIP